MPALTARSEPIGLFANDSSALQKFTDRLRIIHRRHKAAPHTAPDVDEARRMKHLLQERWSRLNQDDVEQVNGDRSALLSVLQKYYNLDAKQSESVVDDWLDETRN
jgi:hypothetical protein